MNRRDFLRSITVSAILPRVNIPAPDYIDEVSVDLVMVPLSKILIGHGSNWRETDPQVSWREIISGKPIAPLLLADDYTLLAGYARYCTMVDLGFEATLCRIVSNANSAKVYYA